MGRNKVSNKNISTKTELSIDNELQNLIEKLLSISQEYILNQGKISKFLDQKEKPSIEEYKKLYEQDQKNRFTNHAYLIYAFAIFEQFLSKFLKYLIINNEDVGTKFFGKWDGLFDKKNDYTKYDVKPKILRSEQDQISNYDVLLRFEKTTLTEFINNLLGIKEDEVNGNIIVRTYIARYNLFREVRNLLTHRGNKFDDRFFQSIKKNKRLKDNPEEIDRYLNYFFMREKINDKTLYENLIGTPISCFMPEVVRCLIFYAFWFSVRTYSKEDSVNDSFSFFGETCHDIMEHAYEHKDPVLLRISTYCFNYLYVNVYKSDIKKMPDGDKFNFFLSKHLERELAMKEFDFKKDDEVFETHNFFLNEVFSEDIFNYDLFNQNHICLLKYYLSDEKENFLEEFKKFDTNLEINKSWEYWFIFKRWIGAKEKKLLQQNN